MKIVKNKDFWVASGPCHNLFYSIWDYLVTLVASLRWVNPKYKTDFFIWTERELLWCHFDFTFKYSDQWSVESISYVILLDRLYIEL